MDNILPFKKDRPKVDLKNGEDIVSLLNLFEDNFQKGEKSVAFSSTSYRSSQEKCIFLAADYFNKKYPSLKIAIVSFKLNHGLFKEYFAWLNRPIEDLNEISNNLSLLNWESYLSSDPLDIVDEYDMVLWDLPELDYIQRFSDPLTRYFEQMDSLYIVSIRFEKFDEEHFKKTIYDFYLDHGLDIKMIIPWRLGNRKRPAKKSLFQRIKSLLM